MLSAGLVHLLGESQAQIGLVPLARRPYPLGPFLCALGFLITLLADQVAGALAEANPAAGEVLYVNVNACHFDASAGAVHELGPCLCTLGFLEC